MQSLLKIISKNFKLLVRSKSSALIIILGPMLVIFLVGIAFDNLNSYSLSIGTYSEGYTELTDSFITKLQEKNFKVEKIASEEECIEQIKQGRLNTCIVFPPGLTIKSDNVNEIIFHVDNSKINLVWMVLDTISSKLTERSSELSLDLTSTLLEKIEITKDELYRIRPSIVNLRTESKESVDEIASAKENILSGKMGDLRTKTDEVKAALLVKIEGAEGVVAKVLDKLEDTNISESEKESISTKMNEINTYLYNMRGKLEKQGEATVSDWMQMTDMINEVDSGLRESLNLIQANLIASDTKINEIQEAVDRVYNEVSSIKVTDAATIVNPITTVIKPVTQEKSYLNYLFPSLIVLVIMFISILLSNTLVMMEKHSPAYFRNFITPTRDIIFILATYLTNLILVFLQIVIILGISAYFFKAQILSAIPPMLLILFLTITFFTFLGMLIGYLFTSEETSTLASISVGSILLLLSNMILPLESMPDYMRNIAQFNPFVLAESVLRKAILFKAKIPALQEELLILAGGSVLLLVVIWISQSAVRKHYFHKFSYHKHKKKKAAKAEKPAKK